MDFLPKNPCIDRFFATHLYQQILVVASSPLAVSFHFCAVIASSAVFAFLLCFAFPTIHVFLVDVSVSFFLMLPSCGFVQQLMDYFLLLFLLNMLPSLTTKILPLLCLKSVKVFSVLLFSVELTFHIFYCARHGLKHKKTPTNYGQINITHYLWNFCQKG